MPAIILIIPLIVAYVDQAPRHHKVVPHKNVPVLSYELPPKTEFIYFVAY